MATPPSLGNLVPLLDPDRFIKPEWGGFGQSNLGIATKRAEPAMHTSDLAEPSVEQGHTVNPSIPNSQITGAGINSTHSEGFQ